MRIQKGKRYLLFFLSAYLSWMIYLGTLWDLFPITHLMRSSPQLSRHYGGIYYTCTGNSSDAHFCYLSPNHLCLCESVSGASPTISICSGQYRQIDNVLVFCPGCTMRCMYHYFLLCIDQKWECFEIESCHMFHCILYFFGFSVSHNRSEYLQPFRCTENAASSDFCIF